MIAQKLTTLIALTALVAGVEAQAQDNSLYAEAAPADASFVRFVGFGGEAEASFAGRAFALSDAHKDAYIAVSAAQLDGVPSGSYATVIRQGDEAPMTLMEGPRNRNTKVFLFLLNATETPFDLRLADNSATVIDAVGQGESGQRGVNPVTVSLGVFPAGSDTALATFDVSLQRAQNLSFVVDADGVQLIENSFGPVAK